MNILRILKKDHRFITVTNEMREELEGLFDEKVIFNDEDRYNLKFLPNETRPSIVIECHSVEDMVEALKFARKHDLVTAIRNGELSILGDNLVDNSLLIDIPQFIDFEEGFSSEFSVEIA